MENYNYREAVLEDCIDAINNLIEDGTILESDVEQLDTLKNELIDVLMNEDRVTGNCSGSYTFSRWQAEEYLCHNWFEFESFSDLRYQLSELDPEAMDVLIRCKYVPLVLDEAIEKSDLSKFIKSE